jgi:hypothetical protein
MLVHCNLLVCKETVEDGSQNYEAFTLRSLSSEYNRLIYITPIFSNHHRMGRKIKCPDPNM